MNTQNAKKAFKVISAGKNLEILQFLDRGEQNVEAIFKKIKIPQNLCSYHLGKLKKEGLVKVRKDGVRRIYSTNRVAMDDLGGILIVLS